ncbi:undecaprenyl-phosphate 4-deoxy-4-formamido-L-arabinose transferase [bacterium BMS3Bbin14]|nr:undecaprenyl-phosphate 4-deoxy-4-formamido-L-arabinose transferase [bacterium BMS3Abin13]GBE51756.1 undecaprenyl-phosphate 4-deoxy-4-formamido-L-arabinose transferase [bacterium BMS3Bbin14]HDL98041.1 glycosyltransferase [Desulfobacteraceae bacterium]HDO31174.1 glycosyltransferase [Desulfobacteraceae bacterium]
MKLSVVIPIYNEEENIKALYDELKGVLDSLGHDYEIIFIDDGSSDTSLAVLETIQQQDPRLVVVSFRRNFGQTAAMSAGFDYATGDVIVTMDGDMQNDPHDIPRFLEKMAEGYDLVSGWRHDRQDPFLSRRLPSMLANKIISVVTGVHLHDYGCTLKTFRKEITRGIRLYGEMHRFIPAIASGMGSRVAEVKVNHRPRRFGKSKYGISRTIRVILDLLTVKFLLSYATRPIQVFGLLGIISGGIGFCIALVLTIERQFFGMSLANRPLLLLAVLLIFMGMQFISLGLLGELQARTYHESQNKPIYTVRKVLGRGRLDGDR